MTKSQTPTIDQESLDAMVESLRALGSRAAEQIRTSLPTLDPSQRQALRGWVKRMTWATAATEELVSLIESGDLDFMPFVQLIRELHDLPGAQEALGGWPLVERFAQRMALRIEGDGICCPAYYASREQHRERHAVVCSSGTGGVGIRAAWAAASPEKRISLHIPEFTTQAEAIAANQQIGEVLRERWHEVVGGDPEDHTGSCEPEKIVSDELLFAAAESMFAPGEKAAVRPKGKPGRKPRRRDEAA